MRSARSLKYRSSRMLVLLAAMAVLLPLLAALQYYWLGQVSQGASERLQSSLRTSATAFRHDFNREFIRAYLSFHIDSAAAPKDIEQYHAERLNRWNQSAPYPRLISNVFVVNYDDEGRPSLSRLNTEAMRFESTEWTGELLPLRQRFEQHLIESFADEIPALIVPFPLAPSQQQQGSVRESTSTANSRTSSPPTGFTIVKLDLNYLQREFIPSLLQRHLFDNSQSDYNHDRQSERSGHSDLLINGSGR